MTTFAGPRLIQLGRERGLSEGYLKELTVVTRVLPFKVNSYVVDELINWSAVPDDPIFRLTFPHRDMLPPRVYTRIEKLLDGGASAEQLDAAIRMARMELNPHPGKQLESNVPILDGQPIVGMQHKYRETVLVFPAQGQTCHAYCGYCFRWAQFVGMPELRQALREPCRAAEYLRRHPAVTDVLVTGGDPLTMATRNLEECLAPLLEPGLEHIRTIRLGTKALAYWPYRFTSDRDAPQLLQLLERVAAAGRNVALMAHFSHPAELGTPAVEEAIRRLRGVGVTIRAQAPLVAYVNDDAETWARLWQRQVELGILPYYMFVERDTGAREYFGVPLVRALEVYQQAVRQVSGLARSARGPVMSTTAGKVVVDGVAQVGGAKAFVLRFLQARQVHLVGQPFFAHFDPHAEWFDELEPLVGSEEFFGRRDAVSSKAA